MAEQFSLEWAKGIIDDNVQKAQTFLRRWRFIWLRCGRSGRSGRSAGRCSAVVSAWTAVFSVLSIMQFRMEELSHSVP